MWENILAVLTLESGIQVIKRFECTSRRSCFVGKIPSIAELFEDAVEEINDVPTDYNENNLIDLIDLPKAEIKKSSVFNE